MISNNQIQNIVTLGGAIIGVILGYFLASFKEWLNRNRLRYCLLKYLWHEIANFELKPSLDQSSHLFTPYRFSTIEHILSSGILSDKKYHVLLIQILELRGWWYNSNMVMDLANKRYAIVGDNKIFNEDLHILHTETYEQTERVRREIKKLFPNI